VDRIIKEPILKKFRALEVLHVDIKDPYFTHAPLEFWFKSWMTLCMTPAALASEDGHCDFNTKIGKMGKGKHTPSAHPCIIIIS
jgi:hypothetical protein